MTPGRVAVRRTLERTLFPRRAFQSFAYVHPARLGPVRPVLRSWALGRRQLLLEAAEPPWEGETGFLYDLARRLAYAADREEIIATHYRFTIAEVEAALAEADCKTIVEYGCGPGILLELLGSSFPDRDLVGVDSRRITLACNARILPGATWLTFDDYPRTRLRRPILLVLDGTAEYMETSQVRALAATPAVRAIAFFYASDREGRTDLPDTLREERFRVVSGETGKFVFGRGVRAE